MSLLDDQIQAAQEAVEYFRRLGRLRARKDKSVARLIDLAMGMELILKNLRFQKENEAAFRTLASDILAARQDAAVNQVLSAFPGASITEIDIEELAGETEMIKGPGPEFPRREARFETVSVTLRMVREKSIAVTDGTMTEVTDPQTGEIKTRERWEFLPRYYVEIEGVDMKDTDALEALKGKVVKLIAEERMLAEKGLI